MSDRPPLPPRPSAPPPPPPPSGGAGKWHPTAEQEIRRHALAIAAQLVTAERPEVARSGLLWTLADQCAAYIRTGERAS